MKMVNVTLLSAVFLVSPVLQTWAARPPGQKALLEKIHRTTARLTAAPNDAAAQKEREQLAEALRRAVASPNSLREQFYWAGALAFLEMRYQDARNDWHKFLEWSNSAVGAGEDVRIEEVRRFYAMIEDRLRPQRRPPSQSPPVLSKPVPIPFPRQSLKTTVTPQLTGEELAAEARDAEAAGRVEYALKLYRLAAEADREAPRYQEKIDSLRQVVGR